MFVISAFVTLLLAVLGSLVAVMVTLSVLWSMGRSSRSRKVDATTDELTQPVRFKADLAR